MRLISAEKRGEADHFEVFVIDGRSSAVKLSHDSAVAHHVDLNPGQQEIW